MIKIYEKNLTFLNEFQAWLEKDEIKNSLIIGIAKKAEGPTAYFVSSIIGDHMLVGVIFGKNMIISSNTKDEDVYEELVEHMEKRTYPGIIGEKEECDIYKKIFESKTNKKIIVDMDQRIYQCRTIKSDYKIFETVRLATKTDQMILRNWYHDFIAKIEGETPFEETDASLKRAIEQKYLYVLESNNQLLTMTAKSRETKNSQTIAMVYTPRELRGKGYASKLVQEVTKKILKYKRYATLYTDLSNPISNSIYMKIGYEPYCDSVMMKIVE